MPVVAPASDGLEQLRGTETRRHSLPVRTCHCASLTDQQRVLLGVASRLGVAGLPMSEVSRSVDSGINCLTRGDHLVVVIESGAPH